MVINCHRHYLFGKILPHNILIQCPFYYMRRWKVFYIKDSLWMFFLFFTLFRLFLKLLPFRYFLLRLSHIKHIHIWHSAKWSAHLIHRIKCFLHTITAHTYIFWNMNHFSSFALWTPANITDILIFRIIISIL